MGSLEFFDPELQKERSLTRESEEYLPISRFSAVKQTAGRLVTNSPRERPSVGYFVPAECSLDAVPAVRFEILHTKIATDRPGASIEKSEITLRQGLVPVPCISKMRSSIELNGKWAVEFVNDRLIRGTMDEGDIDFALANYYGSKGHIKDLKEVMPFSGVNLEKRSNTRIYLCIAFLWNYWVKSNVKWSARAVEVTELGIRSSMEEDNLRRICKKIGVC
jgi:hypothetical protein